MRTTWEYLTKPNALSELRGSPANALIALASLPDIGHFREVKSLRRCSSNLKSTVKLHCQCINLIRTVSRVWGVCSRVGIFITTSHSASPDAIKVVNKGTREVLQGETLEDDHH